MAQQAYLETLENEYRQLCAQPGALTPQQEEELAWYKGETLKTRAALNEPNQPIDSDWATRAQLHKQVSEEFGYDTSYQQGLSDYAEITKDPSLTDKT